MKVLFFVIALASFLPQAFGQEMVEGIPRIDCGQYNAETLEVRINEITSRSHFLELSIAKIEANRDDARDEHIRRGIKTPWDTTPAARSFERSLVKYRGDKHRLFMEKLVLVNSCRDYLISASAISSANIDADQRESEFYEFSVNSSPSEQPVEQAGPVGINR